jgi:hypothetical protein
MAFIEAPQTLEEVTAVPRLVKGACLLNMVWRGKTPDLSDITPQQAFRLAGAQEWDRYRTQFRTPPSKQAAE